MTVLLAQRAFLTGGSSIISFGKWHSLFNSHRHSRWINDDLAMLSQEVQRFVIFCLLTGLFACGSSDVTLGANCTAPCAQDEDCGTGKICVDSCCKEGCRETADCALDQICNDGACVTPSDYPNPWGDSDETTTPADRDDSTTENDTITENDDDTAIETDQDTEIELPPADEDVLEQDEQADQSETEPEIEIECTTSGDCNIGEICLNSQCVEGCWTNRDCSDNKLCQTVTSTDPGQCVDCLNNNDCDDDERCVNSICKFSCRNDNDCTSSSSGPFCDTSNGVCVRCISDGDCDINYICISGDCQRGCRTDRDCDNNRHCDPLAGTYGTCYQCMENEHCTEPRVCESHQCVVDCSQIECPEETPICHSWSGECLECMESAHCSEGEICKATECVIGCYTDEDCLNERYCRHVGDGLCVECLRNEHCSQGFACVSNDCVPSCETDADCPSNLHCKTVGNGECVQCLDDNHCTGEARCIEDICQEADCSTDSQCPIGDYCHPLLGSCEDLPSDSCSSTDDCQYWPWDTDVCDPLTRQCVPGCVLSLLCLDETRSQCIEDACYECSGSSDCPGTRCDPFDRLCDMCRSDSDCITENWLCDPNSGSCHECFDDWDCPSGMVCHPDLLLCKQCVTDNHCILPSYPECGKNYTCLPPCHDECVEDAILCNDEDETEPIGYHICGDYDNDHCLEWSPGSYLCTGNQTCRNDACSCEQICTEGQTRCDGDHISHLMTCEADNDGCTQWSLGYCPTDQHCSGNQCVDD